MALHVDVHMDAGDIYWCDHDANGKTAGGTSGIRRMKPDGSGSMDIITTGIGSVGIRGIAVDWIARNLLMINKFECMSFAPTIIEAAHNGQFHQQLKFQWLLEMGSD